MAVLEETNVEKRLALALELIKKELQMSKMQRDISKKVEDKIKKAHHEHMLREQLKGMVFMHFWVIKFRWVKAGRIWVKDLEVPSWDRLGLKPDTLRGRDLL